MIEDGDLLLSESGAITAYLLEKFDKENKFSPLRADTDKSERETALHLGHITEQLADKEFILGDKFSAADFGVTYVVSLAKRLDLLGPYPVLQTYLERNLARPAYKRAVEKAVEYILFVRENILRITIKFPN